MFCVNCGQKLDTEYMKFCPCCGDKITFIENKDIDPEEINNEEQEEIFTLKEDFLVATLQRQVTRNRILEPLEEIQWESESVYDEEVNNLFWKHMGSPSQYGEKIILTGPDHSKTKLEITFCEKLEISEPIMIFDYGTYDYFTPKGMVLNCQEISYHIDDKMGRVSLCEIENVIFVKRVLLLPAMYFRLKGGGISGDIYLTGIDNPEEFVDRFRKFIFELNHIGHEEQSIDFQDNENGNQSNGMLDDISQRINQELSGISNENRYRSEYCEFGDPISLKESYRLAQATEYFDINPLEYTYFLCDSSMSGKNCTEGFAFCTGGFRFRYEKQTGVILWKQFPHVIIKKFINCVKIDGMIFSSAFETKKILSILWQVQSSMKEIYK